MTFIEVNEGMDSSPKHDTSVTLLSLKLFQTCTRFLLLLNTKEDFENK